jgi:hypothetical protein
MTAGAREASARMLALDERCTELGDLNKLSRLHGIVNKSRYWIRRTRIEA